MTSILSEKRPPATRCPLDRRQQQSIAISQREEFLLRAGAKALLADDFTALVFDNRRSDHFSSSGRAVVNQDQGRSGEQHRFRIGIERLQNFLLAADRLGNRALLNKKVCDA